MKIAYYIDMTVNEVKEKVAPILKRHRISRAAVFGSIVRNEATEKSDVDILVEIPHAHGLFEFVGIKLELEDALGKKVDLIEYQSIKSRIKKNILSSQVQIL